MRKMLLVTTALTVGCGAAWAQEAEPKWGPSLDMGGKWGTERSLFETDALLPVWQDERRLLFVDIRGMADDNGSQEGNLGLGYRVLRPGGQVLGAYGFFDRRSSPEDNLFSQVTLGGEWLGRDIDLRGNVYLPVGDRRKAADSATSVFHTTAPLPAGWGGATDAAPTLRMRAGYEHALHGADAEVGWRVPLNPADANTQLRLYAGGYWFDHDDVEHIAGPRLRAELTLYDFLDRPDFRLTISGELQHDNIRDTQAFAGLRLRVPLQGQAPTRRLSATERRMVDPIVRDVDIVTHAAATGPSEPVTTPEGRPIGHTLVASPGEDVETLLAELPDYGLLVVGGEHEVTDTLALAEGQILAGRMAVLGMNSGQAGSYTAPGGRGAVHGAIAGNPVVELALAAQVRALEIENTALDPASDGIEAVPGEGGGEPGEGGGEFEGQSLDIPPVMARVVDSRIVTNGAESVGVRAPDALALVNNDIITFGASAHGLTMEEGDVLMEGNRITTHGDDAHGIYMDWGDDSELVNNTVTTYGAGAHALYAIWTWDLERIEGNRFTTYGDAAHGVLFEDESSWITLRNNVITTSGDGAMGFVADEGIDVLTFTGNTVRTGGSSAHVISIDGGSDVEISGNTLFAVGGGWAVLAENGSDLTGTGNVWAGNGAFPGCSFVTGASGSVGFTDGGISCAP